MTAEPLRPAAVRWNDWTQAAVPAPTDFNPTLPVSVIVPFYQSHAHALPKTLAALESQSYPRRLFEVVIVDDGSDPPLAPPRGTPFKARVVHQERRGFGLARARNAGVRNAAHDILLFLDSDVLAGSGWIAAHARWHHGVADALTLGGMLYVDTQDIDAETIRGAESSLAGLLAGRRADPPRAEGLLRRTNDLRAKDDAIFMAMAGNSFGVRRAFYDEIGGSDESFARWGYEDTEFAYRAYVRGGLLAPVRDAVAWHQGRFDEERSRRGSQAQRQMASHRIAHRLFRGHRPGRIFDVPEFVVTLHAAGVPVERVIDDVSRLLADRVHDMVVRVVAGGGEDDRAASAMLQEAFGTDPRVRLSAAGSALDEFPASPFHATLPAGAAFGRHSVHRLRGRLGGAVAVRVPLPDGARIELARAWALHRARRAGGRPEDYGDVRMLSARAVGAGPSRKGGAAVAFLGARAPGHARAGREPYSKRRRLADSVRRVRSVADAWAWIKWAAYCCRRLVVRSTRIR